MSINDNKPTYGTAPAVEEILGTKGSRRNLVVGLVRPRAGRPGRRRRRQRVAAHAAGDARHAHARHACRLKLLPDLGLLPGRISKLGDCSPEHGLLQGPEPRHLHQ